MLYGFDQSSCDIARAFLEVQYHPPTIGSAPHESGTDGRNADLDKSDPGVGIIEKKRPKSAKSQVLTSEQTDGNRDGTVPWVNPITTAPRLVASQAGLFHCPNLISNPECPMALPQGPNQRWSLDFCRTLLSVVAIARHAWKVVHRLYPTKTARASGCARIGGRLSAGHSSRPRETPGRHQ